jgi:phospholipase C
VQGFGDKATIMHPGGLPVWQQPSAAPGQPVTSTQYPWPMSSGTFSGTQPPFTGHLENGQPSITG